MTLLRVYSILTVFVIIKVGPVGGIAGEADDDAVAGLQLDAARGPAGDLGHAVAGGGTGGS